MSSHPHSVQDAGEKAKPALIFLGRLGYAARGLIYVTVGVLAVMAALGQSEGSTTGAGGAAGTLRQMPLGQPLLIVIGIGLIGYAIWRFVQAGSHQGEAAGHSTGKRVVHALDGLLHVAISFTVFSVAAGGRSSGDEQRADDWTATLMAQPFGRWLVVIAGLAAIAGGIFLLRRALKRDYNKVVRADASLKARQAITKLGRFGESARAVVFAIVGVFLLKAGWEHDPQESVGLAGALHALAAQPVGWLWLGLIALGFVAFGLYSLLQSRYRRIA